VRNSFFHVDTDGLAAIYRGHGRSWEGPGSFFVSATESALLFFREIDVRATFFVIAEDLDDVGKLQALRSIVDAGHEIACHGFRHRYLHRVESALKHEEIVDGKARIEDVLGRRVRGFRAPGYSIDRESLEIIAAAGYEYDSSIFPNSRFRQRLGVRHLPSDPYEILPEQGLMEFPMPTAWPGFPPFHPAYAFYLRRPYFHLAMRRFAKRADHLTLLFHFTDFAEPQEAISGLRLRIFTNDFFSAESKRRFLGHLVDDVRQVFDVTTTEAFLDDRGDTGSPGVQDADGGEAQADRRAFPRFTPPGGQLMAEISADGQYAARVRVKDISRGGVRLGADGLKDWVDTRLCVVRFFDEARRVRPSAISGRVRRRGVDDGDSFIAIEFAQPLDELVLPA
jgi:peptidoglycan/xylan/chitin deacetylase (PgdA/CDA1 family)